MKKNVLSVALLMMSGFAFGQVGIGTANPNPAALLDVEAKAGSFKGVLIPRVPLSSTSDNSSFNGKNTPNSLLVFNTTDNKDLKPGYYYWFDKSWVRLISSTDDLLEELAINEELAVNVAQQSLYLRDTKNNVVSVPLADINLVTTLTSEGDGKYVYRSEDNTETIIDVATDVINNISLIINQEEVINEIIQSITVNAKALTGDESIEVVGGEHAVLATTQLRIKNAGITPAKIQPGGLKQLLVTDENGVVAWVDATDDIIKEVVEHNEVVTLLVDGGDGTFTYYNEKGIDANGNVIPNTGVKFDANTLRIVKSGDNKYEFYDKTSDTTPIAVIDVAGSVIENITEILNDTTVQNDIYNAVAAQGKAATAADGSIQVDNGGQAVLNEMQISVANAGITPAKIQPGGLKQLLVTDENGVVAWVDATDDIIKEVVEHNEVVTLLVDGGDGTFTYYNEKGIDADGNVIPNAGVKFDANTLRIVKSGDNKYEFYDKTSDTTPIAVIDVAGSVIENITEILNDTTVQNDIYNAVAAQGKAATAADGSIQVDNGGQAVLNEMQISVANAGITPAKIQPGGLKQLLVTDENGVVAWVDATDDIIKEVVEHNEVVTLLVDGGDGTFTYYNEKGIDADGNVIPGMGVKFDANTLRIKEREGSTGKGIFDFYDGATTVESPLMTINTRAKSIVYENNSTSIQGGNVQDVLDNIIRKVEQAQGSTASLKGNGILVNNQAEVTNAVLKDITLTLADDAVTETKILDGSVNTFKLRNEAVTTAKIKPGGLKQLLVTDENGVVAWVDATDDIIKEVVEHNEVVTLLVDGGDGTFTYYNEKGIDADGNVIPNAGVKFDANTLRIVKSGDNKYEFYDKTSDTTPIAVIDVAGSVIENITEILNDTTVQNDIYNAVAAQGKAATAADGSIQVDNGGQAVLNEMQISVANAGITPAKIQPGGLKQLLVTDENGVVAWVDATDDIIKEVVEHNEVVTLLVDGGDGTFTYYNEKGIDADGNVIPNAGVKFDANTLRIVKSGDNKYEFYDKTSDTTPIAVIDVAGSVIENITEILNDTTVQNDIYNAVAAQGKAATAADGSIQVDNGDQAVLNAMQISVANAGITPAKIQPGGLKQLLVTDENGVVAWVDATDDIIKEVVEHNEVVTLLVDGGDGTFTYYNEKGIDANGDIIPGSGIAFDANTLKIVKTADNKYEFYDKTSNTTPIGTIDVTSSVIENITEILNTEEVQNEIYNSVAANGKKMASSDGSISVTGGNKAVLNAVTINIENEGVTAAKIKNKTITAAKMDVTGVANGAVLTADGLGNASYQTPTSVVAPAMQGDLVGETDVINVIGGENVLFGDTTKKVTIEINAGGIANDHLRHQSIKAEKFDATGETAGHVATVNADGSVSYQALTPAAITSKGDITTDGVVTVNDGVGKVLGNVHFGIKNQSVEAGKLDATGAPEGAVATVNADGSVAYKVLEASAIAEKGDITTDGIIKVDNGTAKVLADVNLSIEDKSITAAQITDGTITNDQIAGNTITVDKISAGNEPPKRALVIDEFGVVKWGELDDLVTDAAGNLTTDNIVEIQTGDGINTLFNDVKLGIKDGSITNKQIQDQTIQIEKLSSIGATGEGMILVSTATGGFEYVARESIETDGEDLKLDTALEFVEGNGVDAVLVPTKIGVKNAGITTVKLADGAVTPAKINAIGAEENAVLTADGQGNVSYKKINETVFEGTEADLVSDGSLLIPEDNKAVLNELTIGIADSGVKNQHLENKSVTVSKINAETAGNGAVLTADGAGNTTFKPLNEVALVQGQAVSSSDQSIAVPAGNKATLQPLDIMVATGGIKKDHLAAKAVTEDKIGSNKPGGLLLTTTGQGGAEFRSLGQVIGNNGKEIVGEEGIEVVGGQQAALADVTLSIKNGGVTNEKLAENAVATINVQDQTITAAKILGDEPRQILGTDASGLVKWMDADDSILTTIIQANEIVTVLKDNEDGTFTYYNEKEVDADGNVKPNAVGSTFDANTLKIVNTADKKYQFFDGSSATEPIATIDVEASVIENITEILNETTVKEEIYETVAAQGKAITAKDNSIELVGGSKSVLEAMQIAVANAGITPAKIAPGIIGQLLVTNEEGNVAWVDATSDIIETIVNTQERITLLQDNGNGTFTYFNENDVTKEGTIVGDGITFNANTLRIDDSVEGKYVFYNEDSETPLATIDIAGTVIENITEILNNSNVQNDIYNTVAAQGKDVTGDASIEVTGGEKAALQGMAITLKNDGVTTAKIKDLAVTENKLFAGVGKANHVPVAQADGSVVYQPMAAVVQGKQLSVDPSLEIVGDASKAVLQPIELKIKEDGIETAHLQDRAVTATKISAQGAADGAVLTADGSGNAVFKTTEDAIAPVMNGDLVGQEGIIVQDGTNVLFGADGTQAIIKINDGGVRGKHIAANAIKNNNIVDQTIEATKLTAGAGEANRVAMANAAGEVVYQILSAEIMTEKGDITTDNIITVSDNGVGKVLADVALGIANNSIPATKLNGGGANANTVAMVGANGTTVTYEPITPAKIVNKGKITTDNIVVVDNGVDKVLGDLKLSIKNQGITTTQLANEAVGTEQLKDNSVTIEKISAEGITAASMLVTQGNGVAEWAELGDIVSETAGDLTTDNIIQITSGEGEKSLLKDVTLGIANQSITSDKLSSKVNGVNKGENYLLVTNNAGGFDYVLKEAVQAGGEDLELGSALVFTEETTGLNAVLAPTKIDVAPGGIGTDKLATGAVTPAKITAENAAENTVLTANSDGTVAFKALSNTAFEGQGEDLTTDGSIQIAENNKALLATTAISIAELGVSNKHIQEKAVTPSKISAVAGTDHAPTGTVLTADGNGNAIFQSFEALATTQGKALLSDPSIAVSPTSNKAALQDLSISVAKGGIKKEHIATRNVTLDKLSTDDSEYGLILGTDGQGGVELVNMVDMVAESGKRLTGGTGISVTGVNAGHALLAEATVSIIDEGVTEAKLGLNAVTELKIADKNVTAAKLSSKVGSTFTRAGNVLTSDGRGGVTFEPAAATEATGKIDGGTSPISVVNGTNAVTHDVQLSLKPTSIDASYLADNAVTTSKIEAAAVTATKIKTAQIQDGHFTTGAVSTRALANEAVTNAKLASNAITEVKIQTNAVTFDKIKPESIYGNVVKDKGITASKIDPLNATTGHVLTVKSNGTVAFEAPTGTSITRGNLNSSSTIEVTNGTSAVLKDVELKVKGGSIKNEHIAYNSIGFGELETDAIYGDVIKDEGVSAEKISSKDESDNNTPEGYVMTSDGTGGASFQKAKGGNSSFFYAPSFVVEVYPGNQNEREDVYEIYKRQFQSAISSRNGATLNVYQANELDFFILYYDKAVFENVSINEAGMLKYDVKRNADVTEATFFNVAMQLRQD
ncbi:hypothetical protein [Myroides sp. WP-1]|uniref:hypothetical protein n=1 Tax=Myroides sp. WP-1 TaxID=2759944 RepID=UPI0015F9BF6E|nr:hypothetical protein [Myroides sp. WP-1]MBB1138031.1 hypothetical protein [Myroides sp. WP-1]